MASVFRTSRQTSSKSSRSAVVVHRMLEPIIESGIQPRFSLYFSSSCSTSVHRRQNPTQPKHHYGHRTALTFAARLSPSLSLSVSALSSLCTFLSGEGSGWFCTEQRASYPRAVHGRISFRTDGKPNRSRRRSSPSRHLVCLE